MKGDNLVNATEPRGGTGGWGSRGGEVGVFFPSQRTLFTRNAWRRYAIPIAILPCTSVYYLRFIYCMQLHGWRWMAKLVARLLAKVNQTSLKNTKWTAKA